MDIQIEQRPAHAIARLVLGTGDVVQAEAGALVGMTPNVQMVTGAGGVMKGIRRLFGGESFFRNTFTAPGGHGQLLLAPRLCGDLTVLDVGAQGGWCIQSTGYVASVGTVDIETGLGGFRGFFSGAGIFVLRTRGQGQVLVGGYGAIERIDIDGDHVIDTGHLVAWSDGLEYSIGKAADGWIASFLSGEGLVCRFRGRGTAYIQTRNPTAYGQTLGRLLPPRE